MADCTDAERAYIDALLSPDTESSPRRSERIKAARDAVNEERMPPGKIDVARELFLAYRSATVRFNAAYREIALLLGDLRGEELTDQWEAEFRASNG